ncbi:hypothetical protein HDV02_006550 [Globomyces sp. JEL0801]|nr:hypothetical protein HDV02_006550 [Globomyces sp. JEL0801]
MSSFLNGFSLQESQDTLLKHGKQGFKKLVMRYVRAIIQNPDTRNVFFFLLLNMIFTVVEFLYGWWNNSLGLIADAVHMLFDSTAIIFSLIASVIVKWDSNQYYTYGYGRVETLTGFINALALLFASGSIMWEAVERLYSPQTLNTENLMVVSILGLLWEFLRHDHSDGHSHHDLHPSDGCSHDHSHSTSFNPYQVPTYQEHNHVHSQECNHNHQGHQHSHDDHNHNHSHDEHNHQHNHASHDHDHNHSHHAAQPPTYTNGVTDHSHDYPNSHGFQTVDIQSHKHAGYNNEQQFPEKNGSNHIETHTTSLSKKHYKHPDYSQGYSLSNPSYQPVVDNYAQGSHQGHSGHSHHDHSGHSHGQNPLMHGMFLHILSDALGSVGVIVSTFLIQQFDWQWSDPLCSIFIGVLTIIGTWPLLKQSGEILLQRIPSHLDEKLGLIHSQVKTRET